MKKIIFLFCCLVCAAGMMAQDIIVKNDGSTVTAYNVDISGSTVYYQLENSEDAAINRMKVSDVLIIRKADGSKLDPSATGAAPAAAAVAAPVAKAAAAAPVAKAATPAAPAAAAQEVDLNTFRGYLLDRGSCVYIPTDSPDNYEQAAQKHLKGIIEKKGYWTVVDKPEQAHFIMQAVTNLDGKDRTWVFIRTRKEYSRTPRPKCTDSPDGSDIFIGVCSSGESVGDNIEAIDCIEDDYLDGAMRQIERKSMQIWQIREYYLFE